MTSQIRGENNQKKDDATKCPYCQRSFRTPDDLTLHIVTRHTQSGTSSAYAQAGGNNQ